MAKRRDVEQRILLALRHTIANSVLTNDAIARKVGLSVVDSQVLHLLSLSAEPMTAGELAAAAGLPSSTATRVVDRLESGGYVVRTYDARDRRKVYVEPVPDRLAELAGEYDQIAAGMGQVLARFSAAQLEVVARFLEALTSAEHAQLSPRAEGSGSARSTG